MKNDKKSKINKNNSVKFSIGEYNSPKNDNSESNFIIYSEEFSLIQSKSLTNFPKLLKNTKDKYYIEQNIIQVGFYHIQFLFGMELLIQKQLIKMVK